MLFRSRPKIIKQINLVKLNIPIWVVSLDKSIYLEAKTPVFVSNLLKVLDIYTTEDKVDMLEKVILKTNVGYQDFQISFEDNVVEYYLGDLAGQMSEPLFFELLSYFYVIVGRNEAAMQVVEQHLADDLVDHTWISNNITILINIKNEFYDGTHN